MIQLSLLLLLLTVQTTIQASYPFNPNEFSISTYGEWIAEEAARAETQAEMQAALAAKRRQEKKEEEQEKRDQKLALQLQAQLNKEKRQPRQAALNTKKTGFYKGMEKAMQNPRYTTSMAGQQSKPQKAAPAKKHPQGKNFGVSGKYSCPICIHTTRIKHDMKAHLNGHRKAKDNQEKKLQ